jgi:hypothetical protein
MPRTVCGFALPFLGIGPIAALAVRTHVSTEGFDRVSRSPHGCAVAALSTGRRLGAHMTRTGFSVFFARAGARSIACVRACAYACACVCHIPVSLLHAFLKAAFVVPFLSVCLCRFQVLCCPSSTNRRFRSCTLHSRHTTYVPASEADQSDA